MTKILTLNFEANASREIFFLGKVHRLEQESFDFFWIQILDLILSCISKCSLVRWLPWSRWVCLECKGRTFYWHVLARAVIQCWFQSSHVSCGCVTWGTHWTWSTCVALILVECTSSLVLFSHLCKCDRHSWRFDWQSFWCLYSSISGIPIWTSSRTSRPMLSLFTVLWSQLTKYLVFSDSAFCRYASNSLNQCFLLPFWIYYYLSVSSYYSNRCLFYCTSWIWQRALCLLLFGSEKSRLRLLRKFCKCVLQWVGLHYCSIRQCERLFWDVIVTDKWLLPSIFPPRECSHFLAYGSRGRDHESRRHARPRYTLIPFRNANCGLGARQRLSPWWQVISVFCYLCPFWLISRKLIITFNKWWIAYHSVFFVIYCYCCLWRQLEFLLQWGRDSWQVSVQMNWQ